MKRKAKPSLAAQRCEGCLATLTIEEKTKTRLDKVSGSFAQIVNSTARKGRYSKQKSRKLLTSTTNQKDFARLSLVISASGHLQRLKLMNKLLDGPATYRALQRMTKLKPGPLYHHINQLRLAALLLPKQRDLYELTRAGRNVVLGMLVIIPLISDPRRRPSG